MKDLWTKGNGSSRMSRLSQSQNIRQEPLDGVWGTSTFQHGPSNPCSLRLDPEPATAMHESGTVRARRCTPYTSSISGNLLFRVAAACSLPFCTARRLGRRSLVTTQCWSLHPRASGKLAFLGMGNRGQRDRCCRVYQSLSSRETAEHHLRLNMRQPRKSVPIGRLLPYARRRRSSPSSSKPKVRYWVFHGSSMRANAERAVRVGWTVGCGR